VRTKPEQAGFTLLEVIVALAILSICLSVILRIFSIVTGTTRITQEYYAAMQIADSQLAMHAGAPAGSQNLSGNIDNYYRWEITSTPYDQAVPGVFDPQQDLATEGVTAIPYEFHITVSWGATRRRQLELSTIRLGMTP